MGLLRVVCLISALGCLSPDSMGPRFSPEPSRQTVDDKAKRLEKEPWMKPMLKVKRRQA